MLDCGLHKIVDQVYLEHLCQLVSFVFAIAVVQIFRAIVDSW